MDEKKWVILEYPLSRLLCSYNILDSAAVRRFLSNAVIGFALSVGLKPVSWFLSLCNFIGISGALSHQIVTAAAQTSPFPVGVIEFVHR